MSYELIIGRKSKIHLPPTVEGVNIEWQRKGQPGKLTFSVVKTKNLSFTEGDPVRFSVDGKKMFYGFIFEKTRTGLEDHKINVTAYDQIYYLTKNKDTYVFENKTAADIIRMLAADFHLNLGEIAPTPVNIESLVCDNKSLYDMISSALSITTQTTGQLYVLYDKAGKLTLSTADEMKVNSYVREDDAGNFDYKTSIAEDTYNKVKIVHEDKKAGARKVYYAEDPAKISQWGVLQYYEKANNDTMLQAQTLGILRMYDSKSRTLTVKNVLGNTSVRAGSVVPCVLGLGDMNLSNYMVVEQARHTFKENEHLMELRFEQYRPLADISNAVYGSITTEIPKTATDDDTPGEVTPGSSDYVRTTKPSSTNKYYITTAGGGYNRCILGNAANGRKGYSVLPNCVGYVYGRWMESRGVTSCNLPTTNAKDWYSAAASKGQTPNVGSIAVFGGTKYGHVAYVERIDANGNLYLSESNWSHAPFRNVTVYKSNGYNYSSSLKLLGFVYA